MRFAAGFACPYVVVFVWGLAAQWPFMAYRVGNWAYFAGWALALPVGLAWGVHEAFAIVRPRRVFDLRVRRHARAVFCGVVAGLLSMATALVLLAWVEPLVSDWWMGDVAMIGGSAVMWSAIVLAVLRPVRRGRCVACGYDMRGVPGGRCPECGLVVGGVGAAD